MSAGWPRTGEGWGGAKRRGSRRAAGAAAGGSRSLVFPARATAPLGSRVRGARSRRVNLRAGTFAGPTWARAIDKNTSIISRDGLARGERAVAARSVRPLAARRWWVARRYWRSAGPLDLLSSVPS